MIYQPLSTMSSTQVHVKSNDFKENTSAAFEILREDKDFTDVTLACEDGQQVDAHKVVLTTSSPFFQALLKQNQHPHPLIFMRNISSENLGAIMDFLYLGKANLGEESLESFLNTASELQIKGLAEEKQHFSSKSQPIIEGQRKVNIELPLSEPQIKLGPIKEEPDTKCSDDDKKDFTFEAIDLIPNDNDALLADNVEQISFTPSSREVELELPVIDCDNTGSTSGEKCTICLSEFASKFGLARHQKTKHSDAGVKAQCAPECSFRYDPERLDNFGRHRNTKACTKGMFENCPHCGENLHNTVKLNRHLKRFECEKQFVCDLCNKMFRLPKELENHKMKEHGM